MRSTINLQQQITQRLGFLPAFLQPALETPIILGGLWQQTLHAYLKNPLPALFKEKLFVYLSRHCTNNYFLICHSCTLSSLGMTPQEILDIHLTPLPQQEEELEKDWVHLSQNSLSKAHWESNSAVENTVLRCAILIATQSSQSVNCRLKLKQYLGRTNYNHLITFLGYVKFCHQWLEGNPEIAYEQDKRAQLYLAPLLLAKIELAELFQTGQIKSLPVNNVPKNTYLQKQESSLCKERFRMCFINAPFPMMIHGSDGKILHINKSWTEITGYRGVDIPTLQDWHQLAQVRGQEIVKSPSLDWKVETTFQQVVSSLLNMPYNVNLKVEENTEVSVATCSEVILTTREGEKRFWDLYSAPLASLPNGLQLTIAMAQDITNIMRQESELAGVKEKLQLLLTATKAATWDWNLEQNRVSICDRACQLLGLDNFDNSYEGFLKNIHPSERNSVDLALIKAVKNGHNLQLEYRVIWPDQSLHWIRLEGKITYDVIHKPTHVMGIVIDITNQKQDQQEIAKFNQYRQQDTTQSLEELETILDLLPCHLFLVDRDTDKISFCNQKLAHALGFSSSQELKGKTIAECFPPENSREIIQQHEQVLLSQTNLYFQETLALPDGNHCFDTAVIPLKKNDGQMYAILHSFNEVSDSVAIQKTLAERTIQLQAANKELESFSYSVSHDLQAPLRIVNGFSQVMWEKYREQLDEQAQHYLQRIKANSERMRELIDALLELSRVTRSAMEKQTVNLSAIASEIVEELKATHPQREVKVMIAPDLTAEGDARLLRIALSNLFHNAWKYTLKRSPAVIEFNATSEINGKCAYYIQDNGAGFDPNYSAKLFIPFQRLHSDQEFPGTGIGLATVQRIIYRHGGQVWAEAESDRGATFYFSLNAH